MPVPAELMLQSDDVLAVFRMRALWSVVASVWLWAAFNIFQEFQSQALEDAQPVVVSQSGQLRGKAHHGVDGQTDLAIFLGVPYARPPVGDLRFAAPVPVDGWKSVRDATLHGPQCHQRPTWGEPELVGVPYDEDCLYLDVYVPRPKASNETQGRKLPVIVYLPGGGFYTGSGAKYNFTLLALRGVVIVSVSYRVDVFGFLSLEDQVIPGNFGLLDQALALDWVQTNIEAFNGDPHDVTLMGGSVGAMSVDLHVTSPLSRGKFHKIIVTSGSVLAGFSFRNVNHSMVTSQAVARMLLHHLPCPAPEVADQPTQPLTASQEVLTYLRSLPARTLFEASQAMQKQFGDILAWLPVVDGHFVPRDPTHMYLGREFEAVPSLRGYMRDDYSDVAYDQEDDGVSIRDFESNLFLYTVASYGTETGEVIANRTMDFCFRNTESPETLDRMTLRTMLMDHMKQMAATNPILFQSLLMKGADTYIFEFGYRPSFDTRPAWQGVGHASEKGFLLGLPEGPDEYSFPDTTATDHRVADDFMTIVSNFAKYSNPTPSPLRGVSWPVFESDLSSCKKEAPWYRYAPYRRHKDCLSSGPNSPKSLFSDSKAYRYLCLNGHQLEIKSFDERQKSAVDFWTRNFIMRIAGHAIANNFTLCDN